MPSLWAGEQVLYILTHQETRSTEAVDHYALFAGTTMYHVSFPWTTEPFPFLQWEDNHADSLCGTVGCWGKDCFICLLPQQSRRDAFSPASRRARQGSGARKYSYEV